MRCLHTIDAVIRRSSSFHSPTVITLVTTRTRVDKIVVTISIAVKALTSGALLKVVTYSRGSSILSLRFLTYSLNQTGSIQTRAHASGWECEIRLKQGVNTNSAQDSCRTPRTWYEETGVSEVIHGPSHLKAIGKPGTWTRSPTLPIQGTKIEMLAVIDTAAGPETTRRILWRLGHQPSLVRLGRARRKLLESRLLINKTVVVRLQALR